MKKDNQPELIQKLKKLSFLFSIIVISVGFIVLIGWVGNISFLKSISPGWISMKANTAICFMLAGLSLALLNREEPGTPAKIIVPFFSCIIILLSAITLCQYFFHINTGIDEFLFRDKLIVKGTAQPGRMAPATSVCFMLFGFSFLFSGIKKNKWSLFQWFHLAAGIIAFFALAGYLFGTKQITALSEYTAIAFHTSLSLVILMLAVLFSRPEEGIMKLISSQDPGGRVFRHTFFLILLIIIFTGWLLFKGEQKGLYDFHVSVPIFIIVLIILFAIILFFNAANLSRSEKRRKQSEDHLQTIFTNSSVGLILLDTHCTILELNNRSKYFNSLSFGRELRKGENLLSSIPRYRREDLRKNFEKTLQGKRINFESVYPQEEDGLIITFNVCLNPVINAEREVVGACLTFENITERKKADEKIRKSEERYRDLVDNISDLICTHDLDGNILSVNSTVQKLTGFSFNPEQPLNIKDILASNANNEFDTYMAGIKMYGFRQGLMKIKTFSGEIQIWEYKNSLKVTGPGTAIVRGYARDITDQKKAEKEMQKSEEKFRSFFDQSADAIFIFDETGRFLDVNIVSTNLLGYTKSEFITMTLPDVLFEEDLVSIPIRLDLLVAGRSLIRQRRFKRKDGSAVQVEVHSKKMPDGNFLGVVRDITGRKEAEEKLKQLSQAVEQSSASVVITDLQGNIQYVNQKFINVTGYDPEEVIGKNPRILKSGYTSGTEYGSLWKSITSGQEWQGELHNKKKNGELYWEYALISPIFNEKGAIINFLAIKEDITERKHAETRMLVAFERYDILARATSDTIWDWDMVNNQMQYNEGMNKMFGYRASEVENGIDWWNERVHPDDFQKIAESLDDIFEKGREKFQLTYRFRCANGSYKHIFDRAFVILDENKKPTRMIGAMQDITYQVEEEMRISKAIMDAQEEERGYIGAELHDNVNQILAGSLLALGMIKVAGNDAEKASEFTEMTRGYIGNAIDEIRKLSHQLVPATSKEDSLKDIFEKLLENINLDKRFAIHFHFDEFNKTDIPDEIQINLYRILQEQVKNILKYSEANAIEIAVTMTDHAVHMRISDNGKGFDTKTKKNGIGLSNIKKRAESLSGKFILISAPGKGCEIIVEMPVVQLEENRA